MAQNAEGLFIMILYVLNHEMIFVVLNYWLDFKHRVLNTSMNLNKRINECIDEWRRRLGKRYTVLHSVPKQKSSLIIVNQKYSQDIFAILLTIFGQDVQLSVVSACSSTVIKYLVAYCCRREPLRGEFCRGSWLHSYGLQPGWDAIWHKISVRLRVAVPAQV